MKYVTPSDFSSVTVKKKKQLRSGQWKAYGFANFKTHEAASLALEAVSGKLISTKDQDGTLLVAESGRRAAERSC